VLLFVLGFIITLQKRIAEKKIMCIFCSGSWGVFIRNISEKIYQEFFVLSFVWWTRADWYWKLTMKFVLWNLSEIYSIKTISVKLTLRIHHSTDQNAISFSYISPPTLYTCVSFSSTSNRRSFRRFVMYIASLGTKCSLLVLFSIASKASFIERVVKEFSWGGGGCNHHLGAKNNARL
jgi:hypothetical protein